MMKYFLPIHLDGGNRGCEAIAKGTSIILCEPKDRLICLSRDVELDKKLGLDDCVSLQEYNKLTLLPRVKGKICSILLKFFNQDEYSRLRYYKRFFYKPFIDLMLSDDILLSTGGDMMCYSDNQVIYTNDYAKKRKLKTVLWGCSMGNENLTKRKLNTLKKFDLIYARESLSYTFFKSLGLNNVVCYPDPAFILEPEEVKLPECFSKNKVIGINLSNFTVGAFNLDTPFGNEVRQLLQYIINETNYHILLIPHVFWKQQDDRIIANNVVNEFALHKDRITIAECDRMNYQQIRYLISRCYIFIGARTHAVISAYSTCVPSIALGYSIKSRGIAKDLGLSDEYVVDTRSKPHNGELLKSFQKIEENWSNIRTQLSTTIPGYINRILEIKTTLNKLLHE